jgi:hypothetical protein
MTVCLDSTVRITMRVNPRLYGGGGGGDGW